MEKIKHFIQSDTGKDLLILLIIILVGLGSFELGRLSKGEIKPNIGIDYPDQTAQALNSLNEMSESNKSVEDEKIAESYKFEGVDMTGRNFFASSRGSKYYPFGCSAGKTIKQENRVYFDTEEQAIEKGYTKSSSCK